MKLLDAVIVAVVLISHSKVLSLKVLIYSPALGHSHLQYIGKLADILVTDGHYVHVLIPEWDPELTGNGTKYAQRVTRLKPSRPSPYANMRFRAEPFADGPAVQPREMDIFIDIVTQFCEDFLSNKKLIDELRAEQYDIALTEIYDYCPSGIFELLGIKARALLAATPMSDLLADTWGFPSPTSYVTALFKSFVNAPQLTFYQRMFNLFFQTYMHGYLYGRMHNAQNAIFRRMIREDFPDLKYLAQQATVAFVNSLPIIDIPRPISSKIIFIGGVANKKTTAISTQFANLFEKVRKGVVLFSLGSLVNTDKVSTRLKSDILRAFSRFPDYDFIVKMTVSGKEKGNYPYENIHFFDWIEQVNLLNHPKTKAFITHGGLNSITEAVFSGTPMICIPLFADQHFNTAIVLRKHIGVHLDKKNISTETITYALQKVLNDLSYEKAAKQLQQQIQYYPHNTTQLFLDWIQYTARFNGSIDLNLYGSQLDTVTYYSLDVIAFILFSICCFSVIIGLIATCAFRKSRRFFQKLKKE